MYIMTTLQKHIHVIVVENNHRYIDLVVWKLLQTKYIKLVTSKNFVLTNS